MRIYCIINDIIDADTDTMQQMKVSLSQPWSDCVKFLLCTRV